MKLGDFIKTFNGKENVELHIDGLQLHFTARNTKPEWMDREIDHVQLQPDIYLGICIYVKEEQPEPVQPILITINGGVAWLHDDTVPDGIKVSIRDYDLSEYITDEELAQLPVDDEGNAYEERGNV
jgi:hypothetical protein